MTPLETKLAEMRADADLTMACSMDHWESSKIIFKLLDALELAIEQRSKWLAKYADQIVLMDEARDAFERKQGEQNAEILVKLEGKS